MAKRNFSIGELSRSTGCNIETIRYYERMELIPAPPRTRGGHRSYGDEHLKRLVFIRRGRELGFGLGDIRALLDLVVGTYTCGEVQALTDRHLQSVRDKIADLRTLETTLASVSSQCEGGSVPDCPIVDALFSNRARFSGR